MSKTHKIELSTRRNILDAFLITKIPWYGNLDQPNFLGRLFDLSSLPSTDNRYQTARDDIWKHTVVNDDWPDEWVFTDSRFNLLHVPDQTFLDFLCLTIHPTVRDNQEQVTTLLEIYNNNISKHRFEIFKTGDIAGRPIFSFREIIAAPQAVFSPGKEKRLGLIVGCANYTYATPLGNPNNDANAIANSLQELDFEIIKIIDPTQKDLKVAIDDFGEKLKGYQVGLYFFAGHGVQVKGLNYVIPIDANLKSERMVEYDCVDANRVLSHMEESKCSVNIVILDACRDNPFERSWSRGIRQRGLATMNAPTGSLIGYATSPGKTASDGVGANGLYTGSLLSHISEKGTSITSMFQKVRLEVINKSKGEQLPWESTSLTADFFFNP